MTTALAWFRRDLRLSDNPALCAALENHQYAIPVFIHAPDKLAAWQAGAVWYWDTLVDADLANNTLGWQWSAGCGANAAPWFRIFNTVTQAGEFDPQGHYIRRWLPEIATLPNQYLASPWTAPRPNKPDLATRDRPYTNRDLSQSHS